MGKLSNQMYRPGISFRNAPLARPVAVTRAYPWFYSRMGGGPWSISAKLKQGKGKTLAPYQPVWNRVARSASAGKIGYRPTEMPDYNEMGLGQVPGPTATEPTTERTGFGGFLDKIFGGVEVILKEAPGVTEVLLKRQAEKAARREAERAAMIESMRQEREKRERVERGFGLPELPGWLPMLLVGIGGVVVLSAVTRR